MARNQDRQFSEGDGLDVRRGSFPEAEERLPAWTRNADPAADTQEARQEEPERESPSAEAPQTDRAEADDAWSREAKRVESTQHRPGLQEREEDEPPRKAKGKKAAPKRNSRKKKKARSDEERRGFLRTIAIVITCTVLFMMVAVMVLSNFVSHPLLALPRRIVTKVITPVQSVFSSVTDSVVDYLRKLKIRGNLEYEYEQLLIKNDDYADEVALNEELRRTIQALYDVLDEQEKHRDMNPVFAEVIGTDSSNYFSTLTLNVGSNNGVENNMAVVAQGGLVGVTYNVDDNKCEVSCIINSNCTVAGLVQSSRDQGSVKGTLGTNGEPMCRMYYLPDTSLPRPGDVVVTSGVGLEFPKGIPIGYIRESTRGMEDNKSYVVLEPIVDFQHLEYVTVYRYKPYYAEAAQRRTTTSGTLALEPLATAQPIPTFRVGGVSDFIFASTPAPEGGAEETPAPTAAPSPTPALTATPDPNATPVPPNKEYVPSNLNGATPTPSPRPTATPTPTPVPTPDPGAMTVEDDE